MPNNFTYNNGVPDGPDNPSDDQPDMKINTQSIDSIIAVDHIGFNTNGGGIHKQVTLLNQGAPGLGDGNGVMYANIINGQSWPVWQNALGSTFLTTGPTTASANGVTYLNGGIILQWGSIAGTGATSRAITFPIAFTNVFQAVLTFQANTLKYGLINLTNAGFTAVADSGFVSVVRWIAVGN